MPPGPAPSLLLNVFLLPHFIQAPCADHLMAMLSLYVYGLRRSMLACSQFLVFEALRWLFGGCKVEWERRGGLLVSRMSILLACGFNLLIGMLEWQS